jgi:RNA ligase (TIGR02306 family)
MRKTDQERCQNLIAEIFQTEDQLVEFDISSLTPEALTTMQYKGLLEWVGAMGKGGKWMKVVKAKADADARYEVTLKCDGSSMTVFARGTVVKEDQDQVLVQMDSGVCSRNLQLKVNAENADNTFVAVALKSGLLGLLEQLARDGEGSFAVQGELMGPGIQGNRENLKVHQLFVFDVQNLDNGTYLTPAERHEFMLKLHTNGVSPDLVKHVPILYPAATLQELGLFNVKDLLAFAEGPSISHQVREGLVFKRIDGQFSFKAISNLFLTKEKD